MLPNAHIYAIVEVYCDNMHNMDVNLNRSTVLRLVRYLRVLEELKALGFMKVFSNNLGDADGVTAAVVRKDLAQIDATGNKRGGYLIDPLIAAIRELLGKDRLQCAILAGCGRIGSALLDYPGFKKDNIEITAAFDLHPDQVAYAGTIPVHHIDELERYQQEHCVPVGILSVPDSAAAEVFDRMVAAGIVGVLNFSSMQLKPRHTGGEHSAVQCCYVENINISLELANLFYFVQFSGNYNGAAHPAT